MPLPRSWPLLCLASGCVPPGAAATVLPSPRSGSAACSQVDQPQVEWCQVELLLDGPLPPAGELVIAHEAGAEVRLPWVPSGQFATRLPPGPALASLLGSDGRHLELAFVVGAGPAQQVHWLLPVR